MIWCSELCHIRRIQYANELRILQLFLQCIIIFSKMCQLLYSFWLRLCLNMQFKNLPNSTIKSFQLVSFKEFDFRTWRLLHINFADFATIRKQINNRLSFVKKEKVSHVNTIINLLSLFLGIWLSNFPFYSWILK